MERTTIIQPEGTGDFFDAASYAFGLSYARNFTDQFAIGMNAKYINERYYHSNASGFAVDVGVLFDTRLYGVNAGNEYIKLRHKNAISRTGFSSAT